MLVIKKTVLYENFRVLQNKNFSKNSLRLIPMLRMMEIGVLKNRYFVYLFLRIYTLKHKILPKKKKKNLGNIESLKFFTLYGWINSI